MLRHLHHVDGEFDVHVALDLAAAGGVGELLGRLGHHGVAIVVQPIDERADRGILLIFDQSRVVEGADQAPLRGEEVEKALVIYIEAEGSGGCVKIRTVNEEPNALLRIEIHGQFFRKSNKAISARRLRRCRATS